MVKWSLLSGLSNHPSKALQYWVRSSIKALQDWVSLVIPIISQWPGRGVQKPLAQESFSSESAHCTLSGLYQVCRFVGCKFWGFLEYL